MIFIHPNAKHKYKLTNRCPLYEIQCLDENMAVTQTLRLTSQDFSGMLSKLEATGWSKENGSTSFRVSGTGKRQSRRH